MIRVLQISMGDYFRGAEKQQLEVFKNIDKSIKFDFLSNNSDKYNNCIDEIEKLGGKVYSLDCNRKGFFNKIKYNRKLSKFLKTHKYNIIHINSSAFFYILNVLFIAKRRKVKKIVVHSHSVPKMSIFKKILISIFKPLLMLLTDEYLTCSKDAIKPVFINNKKIKIIKNGIDIDKFKYNEGLRNKNRKKLKIDEKIVYGHIGGFDKNKNHLFLIELFNELLKINSNSILLLIGEGKEEENIKKKIKELKINDKVLFLGYINNMNEIINTFDYFIFPSISEGLGIVAIESQTNGVITFVSDTIPKEVDISSNLYRFNLNDSKKELANRIYKTKIKNRKNAYKYTIESGYDIKEVVKEYEVIYK